MGTNPNISYLDFVKITAKIRLKSSGGGGLSIPLRRSYKLP